MTFAKPVIPELECLECLLDHRQLPESDGTFVKNFQEHPQSLLLTDAIKPILDGLHPDEQYVIGQDCGIYWRMTTPPERGAEAPDWFYVANVPPTLQGQMRRSYVMWQEIVAPLLVLEFVSGNGDEERDCTPFKGKFWVYEQALRVPFYGIYEVMKPSIELYYLLNGRYQLVTQNEWGHLPIEPLGVALGLWRGRYQNVELPWLRWWDTDGKLLLTGEERAVEAEGLLEQERARSQQLAEQLRALGFDPNEVI